MRLLPRRSRAFRLWFVLSVIGMLTSLAVMLGCRKQEEQPSPSGGAVYYTGPRAKRGGGTAPAVPK